METKPPAPSSDDIILRPLDPSDKAKGFLDVLNQLSPPAAGATLSDADFTARFDELAALGEDHLVVVAEDLRSGRIVATGSVFIERKYLRGGGKVGHVEDVVVDANARGHRLGQRIVRHLTDYAETKGCYKVILDCTTDLRTYYEKCGYVEKNIQMARYF